MRSPPGYTLALNSDHSAPSARCAAFHRSSEMANTPPASVKKQRSSLLVHFAVAASRERAPHCSRGRSNVRYQQRWQASALTSSIGRATHCAVGKARTTKADADQILAMARAGALVDAWRVRIRLHAAPMDHRRAPTTRLDFVQGFCLAAHRAEAATRASGIGPTPRAGGGAGATASPHRPRAWTR